MLPSYEEYLTAQKHHLQREGRWAALTMVSMLGFAFAGVIATVLAKPWMSPLAALLLAPAFFAIGIPFVAYCLFRMRQPGTPDPVLVCPYCAASLAHAASIIRTSSNCPNCGRQVIRSEAVASDIPANSSAGEVSQTQPPAPQATRSSEVPTTVELPTVDAFVEAAKQFNRHFNRTFGRALAVCLLCSIAALGYAYIILPPCEGQPPERRSGLKVLPAPLLLLGGVAYMIIKVSRLEKAARRIPIFQCIHCQKWLDSQRPLVIASRNCPHCGQQLLRQANDESVIA